MERIVVTVEFADRKITMEGPEDFVRREMDRLAAGQVGTLPNTESTSSASQFRTERELFEAKNPQGHPEIVTVFAFFLTEAGTAEFSDEEIKRCYVRAAVRPPKVIAQALRDAKNKFDLIAAGSKRGMYKLSDHGERVVRFDLPRNA